MSTRSRASYDRDGRYFHAAPVVAFVHDRATGVDYSSPTWLRGQREDLLETVKKAFPLASNAQQKPVGTTTARSTTKPAAASNAARGSVCTIATMIDFLMMGRVADAVETGCRRIQAVGHAKTDGHWKLAQFYESMANTYLDEGLAVDHALQARTNSFVKTRVAAAKGVEP